MRFLILIFALFVALPYIAPTINDPVSNMAFSQSPAPWEDVVGLYFPIGTSGKPIQSPVFSNLQQCRNWVSGMESMHRGYGSGGTDWACGWGFIRYDSDTGLPKFRGFIQSE